MSESYPSPFFADRTSGIGPAVSSLVQAFAPSPMREARTGAALAQMDFDRARTARVQAQGAAGQAAGARLRAGSVDPNTLAQVFADVITGADPQMLAALPGFIRGFGGAAGADPDRLAQLFVGAGGAYENTQPGFDRTDATRRRGQDVQAGATIATERLRQDGADRRMAPEINPGNVVVVPPNSPLAPRATDGRIAGPPAPVTLDQRRGSLVDEFLRPPEGEDPAIQDRRQQIVAPGVASAEVRATRPGATRPAPNVPAATARRFEEYFASAVTVDPNSPARTPSPEARRWLSARAAELWQSGPEGIRGNPDAAINEALAEFANAGPVETGSYLTGRGFDLPPALRRGGGPSSLPMAPTEGAAPAPRQPGGMPPENTRVRQNGRDFIIRNGRAEPLT